MKTTAGGSRYITWRANGAVENSSDTASGSAIHARTTRPERQSRRSATTSPASATAISGSVT